MATYVIGDVHGCYVELNKLLTRLQFSPKFDKAIFVGDLIGRGPNPLEVLDLIMDLGSSSVIVLGNHDIKFLAMTHGIIPVENANDIKTIFDSPKLDKYVSWLSSSKLIYIDNDSKFIVTHAGIPPIWDIKSVQKYAYLFEEYKVTKGIKKTMETIYTTQSLNWHNKMTVEEIIQYTVYGLTKMKYCFDNTHFDTKYQCAPGKQPDYLNPWFLIRESDKNEDYSLIFGHWAALGLYEKQSVTCCDTACVWGGKLTAIKIDQEWLIYQIDSTYNASRSK